MRTYKRIFAAALTVITAAGLVSCMQTGKNASKTETTTPNTGTTLTFGLNESACPDSGILQSLAQDYYEESGVQIAFTVVPDAQWRDVIQSQLSAGIAPDIFALDTNPVSLNEMIALDEHCMDLSSEEFVGRMTEDARASVTYGDKIYGITFPGNKIWVYSYNKEIFADLNLTAPANYAEFKTVCQTILDSGTTPIWESTRSGWHQALPLFELGPYYQAQDADLYADLNANTLDIADVSGMKTVLEQLLECYQAGYFGENLFENQLDGDVDALGTGQVAMTLEELGFPEKVIAQYPEMDGKIGIFLMPWADNNIAGVNPASNAYFGNANSENKEEILEFFRFLARHENLQKRIDGDPEAVSICWPEIESRIPQEYMDYLAQFETGRVMQIEVKYIDDQWMDVGIDIEKMFAGSMTPEEVLQNMSIRRAEYAVLREDPAWK